MGKKKKNSSSNKPLSGCEMVNGCSIMITIILIMWPRAQKERRSLLEESIFY